MMIDRMTQPGAERSDAGLTTGIIADDLTGGILVAASLIEKGIPCRVVTEPAAVSDNCDAPICLVAGRFRQSPASEAVHWFAQAQEALSAKGARPILYKYCATFDSTDDGNIGPCADALMQHAGTNRLGFCTSFPSRGVTVYQGHIFLKSELLSNSSKRFDPITPMPNPDLVEVLQRQTKHNVALVPQQIIAQGVETTRHFIDDIVSHGAIYLLFDAINDYDVSVCAEVTKTWPAMTGGDTLMAMLPEIQVEQREAVPQPPTLRAGHTAIIAGSCAGATLQQLERFGETNHVRRIALTDAADDFDGVLENALAWARRRLPDGPIGLSIADEPEGVEDIQSRLGVDNAKTLGERVCGELARQLQELNVNRFIVAGGETSGAVAAALGLSAISVFPITGVPGGLCIDEPERRLGCYFKAGKMGDETIFNDLIGIMGQTFDGR